MRWVLLFFLFSFSLYAGLEYKISGLSEKKYSLKEACEKAGFKHVLFATRLSYHQIDCMGKNLLAQKVCKESVPVKKHFFRAFVSEKELICQYGEKANLELGCDKEHRKYCENSLKGCVRLKKIYSDGVPLLHHAKIFSKSGDPKLHCIYDFDSKNELDIDEELKL